MVAIENDQLVHVWEDGLHLHPARRSLLLASRLGSNCEDLREITIGERDRRLFVIRHDLFGDTLEGLTNCPCCHASVEIELSIEAFTSVSANETHGRRDSLLRCSQWNEYAFKWRLPTANDLSELSDRRNPVEIRQGLIQRCLLEINRQGIMVAPLDCPQELVMQMSTEMYDADPLADTKLELQCPECSRQWLVSFDIGSFLWREIDHYVRRLLFEVHILAAAYGWSESSILSLSQDRRRVYLEMVQG